MPMPGEPVPAGERKQLRLQRRRRPASTPIAGCCGERTPERSGDGARAVAAGDAQPERRLLAREREWRSSQSGDERGEEHARARLQRAA